MLVRNPKEATGAQQAARVVGGKKNKLPAANQSNYAKVIAKVRGTGTRHWYANVMYDAKVTYARAQAANLCVHTNKLVRCTQILLPAAQAVGSQLLPL